MKHDFLDLVVTGQGAGRTVALAWPRLTRQEAQARSVLAQRAHGSAATWGGRQWRLRLVPLPDPLVAAEEGEWRVRLQWAGAPFELLVPAQAAQAWVEACYPDLDIPCLPDAFVAPLLEAATAQATASLSDLRKGQVSVDSVVRGGGGAGAAPAPGHAFLFEVAHGDRVIHGRLVTSSLGLMLAAGLVAGLPAAVNRLVLDDLPILLRAQVGATCLAVAEIACLAPGDALLVEHVLLTPGGEIWLGNEGGGLRVRYEDTHLTVVEAFTQGGHAMVDESDAAASGLAPDGLEQLPMRVTFDLGQRTLSLGEVRTLQPGQVIALDQPLASAVNIRVNGALVGTGELVEIDGRLGVVVGSLFEPGRQPLAPQDVQAEEAAE